jgi:hypothetical protein
VLVIESIADNVPKLDIVGIGDDDAVIDETTLDETIILGEVDSDTIAESVYIDDAVFEAVDETVTLLETDDTEVSVYTALVEKVSSLVVVTVIAALAVIDSTWDNEFIDEAVTNDNEVTVFVTEAHDDTVFETELRAEVDADDVVLFVAIPVREVNGEKEEVPVDIEEILTWAVNDVIGVSELSADTEGLSVANDEREEEREKKDDFVDVALALASLDGAVEIDKAGELVAIALDVGVTANGDELPIDEKVAREVMVATALVVEIADAEAVSLLILVPIGDCVEMNDNDENVDKLGVREKRDEELSTDEIMDDLDCKDVSEKTEVILDDDRAERDKLGSDDIDDEGNGDRDKLWSADIDDESNEDRELIGERVEEADDATVRDADTDFDANVVVEGKRDDAKETELNAEKESKLLTREDTDALPERR